ncbi:hypothetical protein [Caballeronia insecticola]|uniref:Uncharacterized protein n=1 Tax=Caballeronia insecticola TaxID=758793 RepID=R4WNP8_9BURK|nr:hypothetical protein [Caballeronia insecticola]BAN22515.1 putative uncharacterized protein [Caballeronia insecticola]
MTHLKRVTQWFKSFAAPSITSDTQVASVLEFDPAWHGDHWQNLLSSPMDARHYVMEDWSTPLDDDLVAPETEPASAHSEG